MSKESLRVLNLIDSLEPGGSEKMAVQLANALSIQIELSALICTRKTGDLEEEISNQVLFRALHKRSSFDLKAFMKLKSFVKSNRINIIHAHSTSVFWGTLLKVLCPKIKLIWHDHYGYRSKTKLKDNLPLYFSSNFFNNIITVNQDLKDWSKQNLNCSSVHFLPNFSFGEVEKNSTSSLILKGKTNYFKIIHVANLRPQKDHLNALKAIHLLLNQNIKISYHIIGHFDPETSYFQSIKSFIDDHDLNENVFIYGSQTGIFNLLKQADLGLLSSLSEGLPVSLLEYAKAELPIVVTDVGQCKSLVGEFGKVVPPQDEFALSEAIQQTITHPNQAKISALKLKQEISKNYNPTTIMHSLIEIYNLSLQS